MLPYQDKKLPIKDRVTDLINRMTIKEKVGQVNQHLYGWQTYDYDKENEKIKLKDNLIKHIKWGGGLGAIYGLFRADPWSKVDFKNGVLPEDAWRVTNAIQKAVIENSRLGIPALVVEECPHGHQALGGISYPTNLGKGNSFDTDLIRKSAHLMAKELALKGVNLALVSTLDLAKDPRWGRSEECFGEDPVLSAKISEAIIEGFQGPIIQQGTSFLDKSVEEINKQEDQIGVVLKHCIAQGEAQGGHNSGTVVIGEREFDEIYQPLLKSTRNAVGVMAAYNDINGVPCHINKELFQNRLREHYKFQGIVMADGIALDRLNDAIDDCYEAANSALAAGVDLSLWDNTYTKIEMGIKKGKIDEDVLDSAVRRVLAIKFLLGLFEHPYISNPGDELSETLEEAAKINEQLAEESMTLVKNDGILPLKDKKQTIAVIGPNANAYYNLLGDYTAPQSTLMQRKTILNEIESTFKHAQIQYAEGCEIRNLENQQQKIAKAVAVAEKADIVILALGGSSARNFDMEFLRNGAVSSKGVNMDSGENVDVADLTLGGMQIELLRKIAELNKKIIAILVQGRPYDIEQLTETANAVLISWFPGQMGARAITNVISGKKNPSGKLSISYPINTQQLPVYYYQRAATKQDNYYDEVGQPLYPFGYGLSYTDFEYSDLNIKKQDCGFRVVVTVSNTGKYVGSESVLLFVKLFGGHVLPRKKILKDFKRITLSPKQSQRVIFSLSYNEAILYNDKMNVQVAETVQFMISDLTKTLKL